MPVVGTEYSETFSTGESGETFTRSSSYIAGSPVTWSPTFSELGDGWYRFAYTPATAGVHEWAGSGSASGALAINLTALTPSQADPAGALASAEITLLSPVLAGGDVELVQGDTYEDDRALSWSTTDAGTWPVLSGAAILFETSAGIDDTAGTVVQGTGANKQVSVALTATDTNVNATVAGYRVVATLSDGDKVTLAQGTLTVKAAIP